jgi:hypothetical protein
MKISVTKVRSQLGSLLTLFISALLLDLFIKTTANDVGEYLKLWEILSNSGFYESFVLLRFEIGSLLVLWVCSQLFSGVTTVFLTGLIAISVKFVLFKKYLNYPVVAFFIYVLTFAHIVDANQIRLALALCVVFYASFTEPESRYSYLYYAFFAILFHYSGIVILCLYLVNRPLLLVLGVVILGLIFDALIVSIPSLSFAMIWISSDDDSVNLTNSFFIMQLCIWIACAINWHTLSQGQKRGAILNLFGVTIYIVFLDNPIVAHRIRELSQIGIFAITFLGERRLTDVKLVCLVCGGYIMFYNLYLMSTEMMSVLDIRF